MIYDLIIIGMGISGISAAIYAKRSNLNVLVLDKSMPGGLLNNIENIDNYPGYIHISGPDLAQNLFEQLNSLEIEMKYFNIKTRATLSPLFNEEGTLCNLNVW